MMKAQRRGITSFIKISYQAYFGMKIGHQDKSWARHDCCTLCTESLRKWTNGQVKSMKFGIPMMRLEPTTHSYGCYLCLANMTGFNRHKKKT